jgi:hypothetical protein
MLRRRSFGSAFFMHADGTAGLVPATASEAAEREEPDQGDDDTPEHAPDDGHDEPDDDDEPTEGDAGHGMSLPGDRTLETANSRTRRVPASHE